MKRKHRSRRPGAANADNSQGLRDSAQKIWLAGLGALERARTDGPRMFESLVEQGRDMGARAVGMADEALKTMREADYSGKRWEKLEQAFEERVAKSLGKLGVLTGKDVERLTEQVQALSDSMRRFMTNVATAGASDGTGTPPRRTRRAPSAAAKAARRRRAAKGAAPATGAKAARPRSKAAKASARKARKPSRGPRPSA